MSIVNHIFGKGELSCALAKMFLRIVPRHPNPDDEADSSFFAPMHLDKLPRSQIEEAMHRAAHGRYLVERSDRFLELFFGPSVKEFLHEKRVLDFGCYFGGTAVAWEEMYGTRKMCGFDVDSIYIEGANAYAKRVGSTAEFRQGYGEEAPFPDEAFDTIVAIDVLEHVHDVEKCLEECWRMLVPNGHLIAVFPTYYHPYAHHLKISYAPLAHWFFSDETLRKAQNEIYADSGSQYAHFHTEAQPYYRLPGLNGITARRAWRLIRRQKWEIVRNVRWGLPRVGRRARTPLLARVSQINSVLGRVPGLDEIFLDRVSVILRKSESVQNGHAGGPTAKR